MTMLSHTTQPVLLLLCLAVISALPTELPSHPDRTAEVCRGPTGRMNLAPGSSVVMSLPPPSPGSSSSGTVFLSASPSPYTFECTTTDPTLSVAIFFQRVRNRGKMFSHGGGLVTANLEVNDIMQRPVAVNRRNTTVACQTLAGYEVCSAKLIVLQMLERPRCDVTANGTMDCDAYSMLRQLTQLQKSSPYNPLGPVQATNTSRMRIPTEPPISLFNPDMKYSFYDREVGRWIYCTEIDAKVS